MSAIHLTLLDSMEHSTGDHLEYLTSSMNLTTL